jgi:hypothetical protein
MTAIAIVIDVLEPDKNLFLKESNLTQRNKSKKETGHNVVANNILKFCRDNKDIKCVAIHTQICVNWANNEHALARPVGLQNAPLLKEDILHNPAAELFSNTPGLAREWQLLNDEEKFRDFQASHDPYRDQFFFDVITAPFVTPESISQPGTNKKLLRNKLRSDQMRIGCWTMNQLIHIMENCYPEPIDTIYFLGGSLTECLGNRPIGYNQVKKAVKDKRFALNKKLFLKKDCVFDNRGVLVVDQAISSNWRRVQHPRYNDIYQLRF